MGYRRKTYDKHKKCISAALTAATLTIGFTIPTMAAEAPDKPVRVCSYKGSTLEVGERSGLIIGPSGTDYTVTSSDPDMVAVEQVLTFWVLSPSQRELRRSPHPTVSENTEP